MDSRFGLSAFSELNLKATRSTSIEGYEIGLLKNATWVDVTPEMEKQSSKFNMQYVLFEGIFSASEKGHMDAFSGSIKHINRVMPWPSRRSQ